MILSAVELPITLAFPSFAETGKVSRRREILRTAVPKLINAYISGTLFIVFRNPTFETLYLKPAPLRNICLLWAKHAAAPLPRTTHALRDAYCGTGTLR
jgi:hypothetical protein